MKGRRLLRISCYAILSVVFAAGLFAGAITKYSYAVQFREVNREGRERMFKILEFVQKATAYYNNRYFENLLKR
jgi:hypothetical protein